MRELRDKERGTISLDQQSYEAKVFKRFNMDEDIPVSTPLDPSDLSETNIIFMDTVTLIGAVN